MSEFQNLTHLIFAKDIGIDLGGEELDMGLTMASKDCPDKLGLTVAGGVYSMEAHIQRRYLISALFLSIACC